MRNIWLPRVLTALLWLLAAGGATYWLLQISAKPKTHLALASAKLAQQQRQNHEHDASLIAQGLGGLRAPSQASAAADGPASASAVNWLASRFQLAGILAQGHAKDGLVMLKLDGQPAQLLRLGAQVEPHVVVQAISRQSVTLANIENRDAPQLLTLELGKAAGGSSGNGSGNATGSAANSSSSALSRPISGGSFTVTPPPSNPGAPSTTQHNAADANNSAEASSTAATNDNSDRAARFAERMGRRRGSNTAESAEANTPSQQAPQQAAAAQQASTTQTQTTTPATPPQPKPTAEPNLIQQSRMGDENLYFK